MRRRNHKLLKALSVRGWNQRELVRRSGVSEQTISKLVCMRVEPKPATARAVADAMGVKVNSLWPALEEPCTT